MAGRIGHKFQIGTDDTECFVHNVLAAMLHHQRCGSVLDFPEGNPLGHPGAILVWGIEGHFAHDRQYGAAFYVRLGAYGGVEADYHEQDDHGNQKACQGGGHQYAVLVGERGERAAVGHVENLGGHGGVGHAYLVFLLLLQQVEIEAFLHLLVTLHR